ncbi:MAG: hypothetical protein IPK83_23640 [Planctomycetes bacterium]|nr:hypothetical protein [Planctomycetota bacterium]
MKIEISENDLGSWVFVYNNNKKALTGKRVTHGSFEVYEFFGGDEIEWFKTDIDVPSDMIDGKSISEAELVIEKAIRDSEFSYLVFGGIMDDSDKNEYDFS